MLDKSTSITFHEIKTYLGIELSVAYINENGDFRLEGQLSRGMALFTFRHIQILTLD